MERATPQAPRRVSRLRMMASAVAAILSGKRIEFFGVSSRKMTRMAEKMALSQSALTPRIDPPVWTGKPRPSFRTPSSRITASH